MIGMVKVYWVVRVVGSLVCREGRHDRHGEDARTGRRRRLLPARSHTTGGHRGTTGTVLNTDVLHTPEYIL